jgi:hypothetical protein
MRNVARWRLAAVVLAISAGTACALVAASYRLGRRVPTIDRFLDPDKAPSSVDAFVAAPIEYALGSNETNDDVFFGESACRSGVDPKRFESLTGLKAYNLGSLGLLGPEAQAITAKAYFENHPAPRVAVLCVLPISFEYDTDKVTTSRFVTAYAPEVTGNVTLADRIRYFAALGAGEFLRDKTHDLRGDPVDGFGGQNYRGFQQQSRESRGFVPMAGDHGKPDRLPRTGQLVIIRLDWQKEVREVVKLCEGAGIKLIVRFLPLSTAVRGSEEFWPLGSWAETTMRECPNVVVTEPLLSWFPPELMYDNIHLNRAGVEKFTPIVAKDVQAALAK